jgi:hypothetical protein
MPQLEDKASTTDLQKQEKVRTQKECRRRIKDERVRVRVSMYLRNQSLVPEKTRATQRQRERISKDGEQRRKE